MKRRVEEPGKQDSIGSGIYSGPPRHRGGGETSSSTHSTHSNARILSSLSGNSVVSTFSQAPLKPADIMPGSVQYPVPPYSSSIPVAGTSSGVKVHGCLNVVPSSSNPVMVSSTISSAGQQHQFQRLKVEDALSYLDQVKFKFGNQPQVYNDFLDIMKEFKSQSIDTPGVIQRVSNLFKGHPELIVGFNTFLPPGYKIEVQSNDQGYAFQVSVSVPSPTSGTSTPSGTVSHHLSIPTCLASPVAPATPTPVPSTQPGPNVTPLAALTAPGNKTPIHSLHSPTSVSGYHPIGVATSVPSHHAPSTSPQPSVGFTSPVANNNHSHVLAQQVVNQALSQADNHASQGQQPVEFNHAINYVNKIKNRFQGQPDKYKRFLEILHTYQKEQRNVKDGHLPAGKHLTEAEVYAQVAKLFEHQEDLLAEFGQFLPDATNHHSALSHKISCNEHSPTSKKTSCVKPGYNNLCGSREMSVSNVEHRSSVGSTKFGHTSSQMKRTPSFSNISSVGPPAKKHKVVTLRDVTLSEAGKYCNLSDYAFFDKVKRALKTQESYENFIRCLVLYNQEIVSKVELVQLVNPFLARFPEMFRWFKDFIGHNEEVSTVQTSVKAPSPSQGPSYAEPSSSSTVHQERPAGELATEIDYTSCKRLGASYCALPKNYCQPKCSGRTALCKEILNDTWVSFPTWSEDSTFVTSRKTQYEEYIYRCEDERFELDVIIETNASTIRVLEGVHKKMSRMSTEEVAKYRLDDNLGGNSPTIHQRAIRRIYGDKAVDIIDGLKKNPSVAVPVVLRRLKAKEEEWREAQKGFNKVWREQNEKYYLKSLDHQGINFKQTDLKALRSKSLYNDIETLYDERHEQAEEASADIVAGPHLILPYKDKSLLDDAASLLIHHVKRQTGIHKEDKQRAKQLIRRVIPDMFFHPRQELSEDEREEEDEKDTAGTDDNSNLGKVNKSDLTKEQEAYLGFDSKKSEGDVKLPPHAMATHPDEAYTLFYANNNWYLFLRLHQILCERLTKMYECARMLTLEEKKYQQDRKESTAVALRLKPKSEIEVEDYYPAFLDMVKNVLDGNMDSSTYEDSLREMFGIHAYIAFTLDKVVSYAVRQLHHLVTDSNCQSCVDLMYQEQKRGGAGGPCQAALQRRTAESAYRRRAEQMLAEENCFKIFLYKHECKMTIELLESENEADANTGNEKWPSMVERFSDNNTSANVAPSENRDSAEDADELESDIGSLFQHKPVFLPRNVRIWKQRSGQETKKSWRVDKDFLDIKQDNYCNMKFKSSSSDDENSHHGNKCEEKVTHCSNGTLKTCQFNLNHYHMVFVIDKESYLYKRLALRRARQSHHTISSKLSVKFHSWHKNWVLDNVKDNQLTACMDWLLGHGEGRMRVIANDDLDRAPYHPYNLYRAIRINIANK